MNLTSEQEDCVSLNVPNLVIKAFAGAGKTSTLIEFAKRRPRQRMLYIVLTKSVQLEAKRKFKVTLVKPVTSHSLAYRYYGEQYQHKLVNSLRPYEIADALDLESELGGYSSRNDALGFAWLIQETLLRFLYSADTEILSTHALPNFKRLAVILNDANASDEDLRRVLAEMAKRLWDKMKDVDDSEVGILHDGYLKLFQLARPMTRQDFILLDEAQDSNPCVLDYMLAQESNKVLVGDSHQAIYGWRGARNALSQAMRQGGTGRYLTGSFRFGNNIAALANRILAIKGERVPVRGLGGDDWVCAIPTTAPRAIISRSNAGVFFHAVEAIMQRLPYWFVGGAAGYRFDIILDAYHLSRKRNDEIRDPFIRTFDSFAELREYAEEVSDMEIKSRCRIVDEFGDIIPDAIEIIKNNIGAAASMDSARVVLSTGHKAKGIEFDYVQVDEDFINLTELPDFSKMEPEERRIELAAVAEDINVLYVAATRARKILQPNFDLTVLMGKGS